MQDEFYDNVINNRDSKPRYYALIHDKDFIGMGGLTNIEWENGTAEISLIISPEYRGRGWGKKAVDLLRHEAILNMRLNGLYGEVYDCGNRKFWEKIVSFHGGYKTDLVKRKYWEGVMFGSMWFSI
jgi:GNAT superfamily N-acetyltransferase